MARRLNVNLTAEEVATALDNLSRTVGVPVSLMKRVEDAKGGGEVQCYGERQHTLLIRSLIGTTLAWRT